jgi:Fic family protein
VLVLAAVSHAQFETIHPFPDGNGRTGRALIHALLRRYELTRAVTVPVSAGLLSEIDGYFAALTAYRGGDIDPIVSALATGALSAVVNARHLVTDLHQMRARWDDVVLARRDATAWRVADLLVRQPVLDAATIARELGVTPGNAPRALEPLVAAGVATEFTGRARNRLWQAAEVLTAVDAFAARAGRRRTAG